MTRLHATRTAALLGLLLTLASIGGGASASPPPVHEVSRQTFRGLQPGGVAIHPDGTTAAAWMLEGTATVGEQSVTAVGEQDVVLTWTSPDARLQHTAQLSSPSAVFFEDIVTLKGCTIATIRSTGRMQLNGRTFDVRARNPDDMFDLPEQALLVRFHDGVIRRVDRPFEEPDDVCVTRGPGMDLVAGASWMGEDSYFGHGEVARLRGDGSVVWRTRHDGVAIYDVTPLSERELAVSVRANKLLAYWVVDTGTGEIVRRVEVQKAPSAGDLGTLAGVVRVAGVETAYGETGGPVVVGGNYRPRPSYAIQPFVLTDGAFEDLAVVTAHASAVGVLAGKPATAIDVIHIGEGEPRHRGVFLALGTSLVPVATYHHPDDDWENTPAQPVHGSPLSLRDAAFRGRVAMLAGTCDDPPRSGCLVRLEVRAP